jgi:hypothetical protein
MAAIGLLPGWMFEVEPPTSPELFVFRAPGSANTVIGVCIPPDRAAPVATNARIHVGTMTWCADLRSARAYFANDGRVRIFAGSGMRNARLVKAIVLELTVDELASTETFEVWGEISRGETLRERIGNPIVAELSRRDRKLAQIHRRISPTHDRAVLTPVVTRIIAARAKRLGMASDPDAYAQRLADAILPDVIEFKPASPMGFSYASRNGRHPAERTAEIVRTLLGASPVTVIDERETMLFDHFPYMISPCELT